MELEGALKERLRSVEMRTLIFVITLRGEGDDKDPVREVWRVIDPDTGYVMLTRDLWKKSGDETEE